MTYVGAMGAPGPGNILRTTTFPVDPPHAATRVSAPVPIPPPEVRMATTDKRVDAYIAKSAPFAQPILEQLRARVHAACPDVEEAIKWGFPNFVYEGAVLCNMAAFKQHCAFGFWKAKLLGEAGLKVSEDAMGQMGRITSVYSVSGLCRYSG